MMVAFSEQGKLDQDGRLQLGYLVVQEGVVEGRLFWFSGFGHRLVMLFDFSIYMRHYIV